MISGIGPRGTLQQYGIPVQSNLPVCRSVWDTTITGSPVFEINVPIADPVTENPELFAATAQVFYHNGTGPLSSERSDFWGFEKISVWSKVNWTQSAKDAFAKFPTETDQSLSS